MRDTKVYRYFCHLGDYLSGARVPRDRQFLVNGFWRSGTSWLLESLSRRLNARSVFEPLNSHNSAMYNAGGNLPIQRCLSEFDVPTREYAFANLFMPYVSTDLTAFPKTYQVFDRALRGQMIKRMYGDRCKTLGDCLCTTVVAKFTRATLSLGAIAQTFDNPIIHLYRDPRAVVASIQALDGGHFAEDSFNQLSLVDQLLRVNDGRYRYFKRWRSDIEALEKTTAPGRIAAYFCLTERFLEDTFQFGDRLGRVKVRYEDLALGQEQAFTRLAARLGVRLHQAALTLDAPSPTDWNQVRDRQVSAKDRILRWKRSLSAYDQDLILDVVQTFKLEDRLWE